MAKLVCCTCLLFLVLSGRAQEPAVLKDSKVFVESNSKNESVVKTIEELRRGLNDWAYWKMVGNPEEADFKLKVDVSASKGITATSWGGTSYQLVARLTDKADKVFWESNTYRTSPNGTNGFNAGKSAVKKLIRDLKKRFDKK